MARCARLEEAATSAGAETERRLRGEIEREKGLARGAEGSVSALSSRLEEAAKEASQKTALAAELKSRLEEVQAFLSQSEDDRKAAEDREEAAVSEAKGMQQVVREAEERLQDAKAELEDRDAVIAAVEDARSAHEREAERLRDKLSGLGKSLTPLAPRANGAAVSATGDSLNDFSDASEGGRDDQVGNAEYLHLLSEHEDLLQLLAQQDVVRKKLLDALKHNAGQEAARAVMKDAEAAVTVTYGMFVHTDDDDLDDHRSEEGGNLPGVENGAPIASGSRTVAV
ncbi:unnamed protein product [Ectocarpus fasciculatus]